MSPDFRASRGIYRRPPSNPITYLTDIALHIHCFFKYSFAYYHGSSRNQSIPEDGTSLEVRPRLQSRSIFLVRMEYQSKKRLMPTCISGMEKWMLSPEPWNLNLFVKERLDDWLDLFGGMELVEE